MPKNTDQRRIQLIRLIHVARRELGMQDDDYRSMLASMTALGGRTSAADLSIKGLELVLKALKTKGFKIRIKGSTAATSNKPGRRMASDPVSRKIRSLWLQLRDAGVLRDSSEKALAAYVKNTTGVEDLAWLNDAQARKVIEGLKSWLSRVEVAK